MMMDVAVAGSCVMFRLLSVMGNFHMVWGFMMMVYGVNSVARPLNMSVESGVFVSSVVNGSCGTIRFNQLVVTFNLMTITFLMLFFDVVSMFVLYAILKLVFRVLLKFKKDCLL